MQKGTPPPDKQVAPGFVYDQQPGEGATVAPGETVTIFVAQKPQTPPPSTPGTPTPGFPGFPPGDGQG